jgi:hypothetical protein
MLLTHLPTWISSVIAIYITFITNQGQEYNVRIFILILLLPTNSGMDAMYTR